MLGYFPVPYKDELLYSVIARFKIHQGIISDRQVVSELFGSRDVAAVVDFPGHLRALEQSTYPFTKLTAEQWLLDHTLFPAYQNFLPQSRREKIITSLYEGRAWDVHTRIGHAAFSLKDCSYLKICKSCYVQQMSEFGEAYWQRLFQLQGSILCPIHQEYLYETDVPFRPKSKFQYSAANNATPIKNLGKFYDDKQRNLLTQLSLSLSELLNVREHHVDTFSQWSGYYRDLGEASGNLSSAARIDHVVVCQRVETYWTKKILKQLNLGQTNWIVNIFRKHRKSFHYLHHLIIWLTFEQRSALEVIRRASSKSSVEKKTVSIEKPTDETLTLDQRSKWFSIVKLHPGKGIAWLRQHGSAAGIYTWLYRHDRAWLKIHAPKIVPVMREENVVDWHERDNQSLLRFRLMHHNGFLINSKGRASKTWMIKQMASWSTIEKNQRKFPLTMSYLATLVETVENYQFRRIAQVVLDLHAKHEQIEYWILYRKAGIRKQYQTEAMEHYIDSLRTELLHGNSRQFSKNSR